MEQLGTAQARADDGPYLPVRWQDWIRWTWLWRAFGPGSPGAQWPTAFSFADPIGVALGSAAEGEAVLIDLAWPWVDPENEAGA